MTCDALVSAERLHMQSAILAIDQGTTNSKAFLFSNRGEILAQASRPMTLAYPEPGWAELDPLAIWDTVRATINAVLADSQGLTVAAVAISNQRESIMIWDAVTGKPMAPCVVWQCRRSSDACSLLRDQGMEPIIVEKSGLGIDPLFPAAKLAWLLNNTPGAREAASEGRVRAGTVDAWLLWNLTAGRVHATDASNASRTQLMNIDLADWDSELADIFDVPMSVLPEIRRSDACFGYTSPGVTDLPEGVPIHAVMGDSHAALFGQGISGPGRVKATLGTGSSLMTITPARLHSSHGLSATVAWWAGVTCTHALEGNISVSGQTAAFATQLLNLPDELALTALAETVEDSNGVSFVPALAGLGAPHWKDRARGLICGMSLATRPAHIARAAFEAIALQIRDVFIAMEADLNAHLPEMQVDGGASQNNMLMQLLCDLINRPVRRPATTDVTALGVARMAGRAIGIWVQDSETPSTVFMPRMEQARRTDILSQWYSALERTKL